MEGSDLALRQREEPGGLHGGYCAWAVSQGYTASADPSAWRIVGKKLYLNYNREVQQNWEKDAAGNIVKADGNWPKVLEK